MRIQHNIAALNSYRNLSNNNSAVSKNLEKLSSGYKINRAGDDAAGLAISEKMRAQITGLETAQKNAQDGISLVQTAEGALTEVHSMLNRMVELANQSANGTYQDEVDRENLQKEIDSLVSEIDRISKSTNFNGINLLDGTMGGTTPTVTPTDGLIVGEMTNSGVAELVTGATNATAEYEIDFAGVQFGKDGVANVKFGNFDLNINVTKDMTASDFASAVADAINKSDLGTDPAAKALREAASGLKFTATADGTKVKIKANGNGVDDVSGLAGGKTTVAITEATDGTPTDAPIFSGSFTSDKVSEGTAGTATTTAIYNFNLSGITFEEDGEITLTVGNYSVDVNVKKGMTAESFAAAVASAINEAGWGGTDGPIGQFSATASDDGSITLKAGKAGEDKISGLAGGNGKISIAMKDPNKEIKVPDVTMDSSTNEGKFGEVTFEFAKGVSDKTKAEFNALIGTEGFDITFKLNTSDNSGISGTMSIETGAIPEGFKLQYCDASGAWTDASATITLITDATSGENKINTSTDIQFRLVKEDTNEVVGTLNVGKLTGDTGGSQKTTTIHFAPPAAQTPKTASVLGGSTAHPNGAHFDLDLAGLTVSGGVKGDKFEIKIGDVTITSAGATDTPPATAADLAKLFEGLTFKKGETEYVISANGSKLTFTSVTAGPVKEEDQIAKGTEFTVTKESGATGNVEGSLTVNTTGDFVDGVTIKAGDKFEMDFSKMAQPNDGDKFTINGIEVTFGDDGVAISKDLEETLKNLAEHLNKQNGFKDEWNVTLDGSKLTFEAKKDDAAQLTIEKPSANGWEGIDKVAIDKVETPEKPSDVKTGDKYEMDFSKMEQPKNGEKITIGGVEVTFSDGKARAGGVTVTIGSDINETIQNLADALNKDATFSKNWSVTAKDGKLTFEAKADGVAVPTITVPSTGGWAGADKITANKVDDTVVEPTDVPTLGEGITLQIGDTSDDYNRITVTIGDMSAAALGLEGLDISTQENAMAAIDKIKAAINTVSATRGDLGAIQNRLEHTINNLSVTTENMTAAESRIRDVDMAKEMMAYTKNNILVQSSQAMLAQANQIPQGVLQLLQ